MFKPMSLDLVCSIGLYQVCTNDDSGLTLTYLTARSNLICNAFIWEIYIFITVEAKIIILARYEG